MSAAITTKLPVQNESKSAKKRKSKPEAGANTPTQPVTVEDSKDADSAHVNGSEGLTESPFLRELTK